MQVYIILSKEEEMEGILFFLAPETWHIKDAVGEEILRWMEEGEQWDGVTQTF